VAAVSSAQLAQLDAGGRHHPAFAGEPAPTLDAALRLCAALGLWVNVEIKPSVGQEAATGGAVARHAAAARGNLLLSSFSPDALSAAAAEAPQLPRAVLVEAIPADWRERMEASGALALHFSARALNAEALHAVRDAGFPLACYTVNRRDDAERLFALGVSGVFTDRPDLWLSSEM
jgi:glycerophosphoryl diester phosphodiesterase